MCIWSYQIDLCSHIYTYNDTIYTLSVLVCRIVVTHTYTISALYLLSKFIHLLVSLNWELLIPMTLFSVFYQHHLTDGEAETKNHEVACTRSCSKTPVKPRTNVMVLESTYETDRCTNITCSIVPPTLYLEAKIFIQICRFAFTLYRFYNPSCNKDFKFILPFGFVLN